LAISLVTAIAIGCGEPRSKDSAAGMPVQRLGRVSFAPVGSQAASITGDQFSALVEKALAGVPDLPAAKAGNPIDVKGSLDTTAGEGVLLIEAGFRQGAGGVPVETTLAATGTAESAAAARSLLERGLGDLAAALSSLVRLARGDKRAWIRALDSAEPDEQKLAAALLGRDRVGEALPALGRLLGDPREPVAEAAADALVAIGDRAAVPLFIESIRRGDLRSEVRAIEAMGRLGGPEVEAYLEMTAIGHEVEEVRRLSARALESLRSSK
jgi:hypothetical protein